MLALTRWPMRVLTSVIKRATLTVLYAREALALRRAVAFEFIGDEHPWDVQQVFEELAEELLCRLLIAPPLYEDVEDVVVLIHGAPQVMALTVDGQKDCIQVPCISGLRAPQPMSVVLPYIPHPFSQFGSNFGRTS